MVARGKSENLSDPVHHEPPKIMRLKLINARRRLLLHSASNCLEKNLHGFFSPTGYSRALIPPRGLPRAGTMAGRRGQIRSSFNGVKVAVNDSPDVACRLLS